MAAEQDDIRLTEVKRRVERLLSYYRELGEVRFVEELELRLRGVSDALRGHSGRRSC